MSDKKGNAREAIMQFSLRYSQCEWSKLTEIQRSEALIRWYIEEVFNKTGSREIIDDDISEALLDGSGDLGGDFYHRTTDGEVLILQAKIRAHGKSENATDLNYFAHILTRLKNPELKNKANKRVREFIEEIDWKNDRFDLRYLALSKIENQASTMAETLERKWNDDESMNVQLRFYGETNLNEEYRNAMKLIAGLPGEQEFHVQKGTHVLEIPGATKSCLMVVPGKQLAQLYNHAKDALFSLNIRAFLGDTKINKEVKNTITESPADFYYYNNGLTCLSTKLEIKDRAVTVSGLQIINGAQTVRALAKAEKSKPGATDDVQVLMRITLHVLGYGKEGRFIDNIVRFNNSQNAMKPADFVSNDEIQRWLRTEFSFLKRFGKEVLYMNKRSSGDTSNKELIPIDDFAKSVYSFLYDPIKFSSGSAFFFTPGKDKGYYRVFGDGESVFEAPMKESEFKLRSAIWWLAKEFASAMKEDKKSGSYGAALERKHFVLYASRIILERNYGDEYKTQLSKYFKGDWRINDDTNAGTYFRKLYSLARDSVVYVYKNDEKTEGDDFNQRNWMRSQKTQDAIQTFCQSAPGLELEDRTKSMNAIK